MTGHANWHLLIVFCYCGICWRIFDLGKKQLNWTPSAKSKTFVLKNVKGPWKKLSHEMVQRIY